MQNVYANQVSVAVANTPDAMQQLIEYKELGLTSVPDDKTCTDKLQRWHVPGETPHTEAYLKKQILKNM